jgi:hypothetical protein
MSFDHMLDQSRLLGSPPPYDPQRLSPEQRTAVNAIPRDAATLSNAELAAHYIPEPDAQYLTRFEKDWLAKVLRQ